MPRNPFGIRALWNPCPHWEYIDSPRIGELPGRVANELRSIAQDPRGISDAYAADPRRLHERLFSGLTPRGQPYLAGNYRGHPRHACLRHPIAKVKTPHGWDETFPPFLVHDMMRQCGREIAEEMALLDLLHIDPRVRDAVKLAQVVESAAYILGGFNVVHPFANGNGHVSRLLVFAFLARYGQAPRSWAMHSPRDQNERNAYDALFRAFRQNDPAPLQRFLYDKIAGR